MGSVFYHLWKPERIATPLTDLLLRLNLYADVYRRKSNGETLKVLISQKDFKLVSKPEVYSAITFIQVSYGRNNLFNLLNIQRVVKRIDNFPTLWIPNDPFKSYGIALILKFFFFRKMKIQLQLHGLIPKNFRGTFKSRVTRVLYFFSILFSYNIRIVSRNEFEWLCQKRLFRNKKFFYAPVPVKVPSRTQLLRKLTSECNLVFLGRIHEERGINLLIQIIQSTSHICDNVKFHIIGGGGRSAYLRKMLSKQIDSGFCTVHGELHGEELSTALRKMDILINCAPIESYGLAMREALMQGVSILALTNDATVALHKQFPDYVVLFRDAWDATQIIKDCSAFRKIDSVEILKIRECFSVENLRNIDEVAKSWLI